MADEVTPGFKSFMTTLSVIYGSLIAVLAILGFDHVGLVAALGAVFIGTGWAVYGAISRKPKS